MITICVKGSKLPLVSPSLHPSPCPLLRRHLHSWHAQASISERGRTPGPTWHGCAGGTWRHWADPASRTWGSNAQPVGLQPGVCQKFKFIYCLPPDKGWVKLLFFANKRKSMHLDSWLRNVCTKIKVYLIRWEILIFWHS